ncbi:MAG: 4-hydroxy-3-methylbut-2-enyl diphosphate reductase [Spirochaetia bacterium]|nr:4-hydroxy-3-methylbut-2-enyl diphosphate reductase [Spirochaetia bacterium]
MLIRVAGGAGFCFGVKRAVSMARKFAAEKKGEGVYSLHDIIHNPQEVRKLEQAGAKHAASVSRIKNGSNVIVSAHGITAAEEAMLKSKNTMVLDTTCPYVKKIHLIVAKLAEKGYQVIIVGDKHHLEVKGILGHCQGDCRVVSSPEEAQKLRLKTKVGIVAQTTLNIDNFRVIVDAINKNAFASRYAEVRIFNTVCDATARRQEAVTALARNSDVMVILGGKNSANTRRLYEISKAIVADTYMIEDEMELKKRWFKGKKYAGVSAGASTSADVIRAVTDKMKKMGDN